MGRILADRRRIKVLAAVLSLGVGFGAARYAVHGEQTQIQTSIEDFFIGGTQPLELVDTLQSSLNCIICHGIQFPGLIEVAPNWQGSMMAQAGRDPLFYACLAIANQDAKDSGDICIRCHSPMAWFEGRSEPTDASAFLDQDRDGVNCHTCHRMVDPVFEPGVSPDIDEDLLMNVVNIPIRPGTGSSILDPRDRRRGPFTFEEPYIPPHPVDPELPAFVQSPFHQQSELCATCHDVSNPAYVRQGESYVLSALDAAHPTGDQYDMFPIERTYSEWLNSSYPTGVDTGGQFGGNLMGLVSTCQDCHMEDRQGNGCGEEFEFPSRPDMPRHDFAGGNSWIRDTLVELWPLDGIPSAQDWQERLTEGQNRSIAMLQRAASLTATQEGARAVIRVTNESGHKLPTGYPEGRRMWLNVQYFDDQDGLIAERGYYNTLTADLEHGNTKVYEVHLGLDAAAAAATGLPEGVSLHFVLNNKVYKDNRIPPRGFTNAAYDTFGGKPVGAVYPDGQYWDDTPYALPIGAASVTFKLYYQTSSKEYIEFLRDENVTNNWGQVLHDQWALHGKSAPVLMASETLALSGFAPGDWDGDYDSDLDDFKAFDACYTGPGGEGMDDGCDVFDFDVDLDVDMSDLQAYLLNYTGA